MEKDIFCLISNRVDKLLFGFGNVYSRGINLPSDSKNLFEYKGEIYYCRYYQKYFQNFIDELLDLSRDVVAGIDAKRIYVFRKRIGILDNGDIISWKNISEEMNIKELTVKNYFKQASDSLVRYFIDYSYFHFLEDINKEDIDKREIYLKELYPYYPYSFWNFLSYYLLIHYYDAYSPSNYFTVGNLLIFDTEFFEKKLSGYNYQLIMHRLHCLGLRLKDESVDVVSNLSEKDMLLEMPISVLNFSSKINRYMDECGIYNILGICMRCNYEFNYKGFGEASCNEIKDKIHLLDLRFANEDENTNITVNNNDFRYVLVDTLYKKLELLQKDLDSLINRKSAIDMAICSGEGDLEILRNESEKLAITIKVTEIQIEKFTSEICDRDSRVNELKSRVRVKE